MTTYALWVYILLIVLIFLLNFLYARVFVSGFVDYQLNKNALKKRSEGQSFGDWLWYRRFKEEIPTFWLFAYYFDFVVFAAAVVCMIVFHIYMPTPDKIIERRILYCIWMYCCWRIVLPCILFGSYKTGRFRLRYSRWIRKKRGQKKDNK